VAVTQGVHGLPEAVVSVGREFASPREVLEWFPLPDRGIAADEIERARLDDEESAVDPGFLIAVAARLLGERSIRVCPGSSTKAPNLPGGWTAVRVTVPPSLRWNEINSPMSTSDTPSP
jgi:hypothetical protein